MLENRESVRELRDRMRALRDRAREPIFEVRSAHLLQDECVPVRDSTQRIVGGGQIGWV